MPIRYQIMKQKAFYLWKMVNKTKDPLMLECLKELFINGGEDPWAKEILRMDQEIGGEILGSTLRQMSRAITNVAALSVLESKRSKGSLNAMPQPRFWFKMQGHIGDSWQSKTLNLARAGNLRLGNRMANTHGKQWKICPWCLKEGFTVRLSETHVKIVFRHLCLNKVYYGTEHQRRTL